MTKDRYIEHSFPIVQLNPLSVRERNAFKPIYKMHKWFARRSSSIFRAILLASSLPYRDKDGNITDLMKEFYEGHRGDSRMQRSNGRQLRVLDPFMGGGTTVVEALRLGFNVTGIDYNPIAWFIVKGETTSVNIGELDDAFQQISRELEQPLLDMYQTSCLVTGKDAQIIYGFWVKQGVCVEPECKALTDLFKGYEVARKRGGASIEYAADISCPHCKNLFDWEFEHASITAGGPQVMGGSAEGSSRPPGTKFRFGAQNVPISCPSCEKRVPQSALAGVKKARKNVALHLLVDPSSGDFFEVRGTVPDIVSAPKTGLPFSPKGGPSSRGGKFSCVQCGRTQTVVSSARAYGKPLPFRYFGYYAATEHVSLTGAQARKCGLKSSNGKWYGKATEADLKKILACRQTLDQLGKQAVFPRQEIADGYNTNRLVIHQYKKWSDLFGARQLLALSMLLEKISKIDAAPGVRDALLGAFQSHVDNASFLCKFQVNRNQLTNVTGGHDYRNPTTVAENNIWGVGSAGQGTFSNCYRKYVDGLRWADKFDLTTESGNSARVADVPMSSWAPSLHCGSVTSELRNVENGYFDLVITDPPYAGSVQYAEMADWSYVWLHSALKNVYPAFSTEITLKSQEIIEDGAEKDVAFFFGELTQAWKECHRVLNDHGLLVFTFHHAEGDRWTGLLTSLFDAGFYLIAAYPTHSEALNSIVIQATKGITYDIIHVCRKRLEAPESIPWSRLRKQVRKQARKQLAEIEQGKDVLPGPDVQMILIGRALMLFSRHYGKVLDRDGQPMDLEEAMERILLLVREVRGEELPLPGKLQNIDSLSQIVLLHVVGKEGWSRDDLHKELRGYKHGPKALLDARLVRRVKDQKAKLEPVPPLERHAKGKLSKQASGSLIDKVHLVLGTVEEGLPIDALMDGWRGQWEQISEALAWLAKAETSLKDLIALARRQIEGLGPEALEDAKAGQLSMFDPSEET